MTKKNIHPETHNVTITLSDGTNFTVNTVWGKEGDNMKLDVDPTNHPAWKSEQGTFLNTNNDMVSKFNKKYGNIF